MRAHRSGHARAVRQVEHVVEEAVLLVPEVMPRRRGVHRVGDVDEVLPELAGDVLVGRVVARRAPARSRACSASTSPSSSCRRTARCGRRWAAARCGRTRRCCRGRGSRPGRRCCPSASLRFTHQVKFSSSLWKTRSRKARSPAPRALLLDLVDAQRRPGVHRRVDVAERPLVGGELAVRVHVPLAQQQEQLLLGEVGVDQRERDAVEGEVPRRVPRVLPLVRHRDDVGVVEVRPVGVAAVPALGRAARGWSGSPSSQSLDDVVVELLDQSSAARTPGASRSARRRRASAGMTRA